MLIKTSPNLPPVSTEPDELLASVYFDLARRAGVDVAGGGLLDAAIINRTLFDVRLVCVHFREFFVGHLRISQRTGTSRRDWETKGQSSRPIQTLRGEGEAGGLDQRWGGCHHGGAYIYSRHIEQNDNKMWRSAARQGERQYVRSAPTTRESPWESGRTFALNLAVPLGRLLRERLAHARLRRPAYRARHQRRHRGRRRAGEFDSDAVRWETQPCQAFTATRKQAVHAQRLRSPSAAIQSAECSQRRINPLRLEPAAPLNHFEPAPILRGSCHPTYTPSCAPSTPTRSLTAVSMTRDCAPFGRRSLRCAQNNHR